MNKQICAKFMREDIDKDAFQIVRLRRVKDKFDEDSMIWNWAITTLRKEVNNSRFSPKTVINKFIERMDLYSVNDVASSWRWSTAKDAGEYVFDAFIFFEENYDRKTKNLKKDGYGRIITPKISSTVTWHY
mgnify:CR=1 FL=1